MPTKSELQRALINADRAAESGVEGAAEDAKALANALKSYGKESDKGSIADPLAQGLSFGFADELVGAIGAIPAALATGDSIGDSYRGIRDAARQQSSGFAERNPATSIAAEIAGGFLTGGVGAAKAGATLAKNTPRLIAAGAGAGAVAGAGYSEGETIGEVGVDALKGAGIGAVGGAVLPPITKAVGKAVSAPTRYARATSSARADKKIAQAIGRDDMTPEKVGAQLRKMPQGAALVDAGGESLQTLGRDVIVQPGRARNVARKLFEGRRKLAPQRIDEAVRSALKQEGEFHQAKMALEKAMKTASGPLYDQAYKTPVRVTPKLQAILKRSSMQRAMKEGQKLAAEEGGEIGGHIQILDYAKRALDDQIGVAIRAGRNQQARALVGTKKALLTELDAQVPVYAEARAAYAGPKTLEDALELGRKFMREDAEIIESLIDGMGQSEKEFFRMGAIRHLRDAVLSRSDTGDAYKAIFNTPLKRQKIEALFPDKKSFARFQRAMLSEAKMFESGAKAMGNSATANKQGGVADLKIDPGTLVDVATGGGTVAVLNAIKGWLKQNVGSLKSEKLRNEIADKLFSADAGTQKKILKQLGAPVEVLHFKTPDGLTNIGALTGGPTAISQSN